MNISNRISLLLSLLLGGFAPISAQATMWDYEMKGHFRGGILSNTTGNNLFEETQDAVYIDPVPGDAAFILTFRLDDTVVASDHFTSTSSTFSDAISDLSLSLDGEEVWFRHQEALFEYGPSTNITSSQWSIFSSYGAVLDSSMRKIQVKDTDTDSVVDEPELSRLLLFLVDSDGSTFTSVPPEMVAVNDLNQFGYKALELRWGGGPEDNSYNYLLDGDITELSVTAVPLPAAFWLFGSAVLGFAGFSRRTICRFDMTDR